MKRACRSILLALLFFLIFQPFTAAETGETKRVLILCSEERDNPGQGEIERGIRDASRSNKLFDLELYTEYLDVSRFGDLSHARAMADFLGRKYVGMQIHVIITVYSYALDFLLANRRGLFPEVPVVAAAITRGYAENLERSPARRFVTGTIARADFISLMDSALRVRSKTKRFAVVGGTAPNDISIEPGFLVGDAAAQGNGLPVGPLGPTIGGPGDQQVPYLLKLPAGINLISAPLDEGSGRAIGAFEGIEPDSPLFFEWDSASQRFLDPGDSMLGPGAGYWYYTPAPTTLLIQGQPYSFFKYLTKDITPGWHLIGVPFTEGIDWSGFRLYANGNPIGLEKARDLGWIGSNILTMQGSEWQTHEAGMPFDPGKAYWIKTTVPLSIRAERAAAVLAGGGTTPIPPFSNIVKIIDNKNELIKTGEDILDGKLTTGGFSGSGAVFGLVNMAVSSYRYNNIMNELNSMDDKINELLTDMGAVEDQLATIESQISELQSWIQQEATLGKPLMDAQTWIETYYSDPTNPTSYNWARWLLAGCDVTAIKCVNSACVGGATPGSACTADKDCFSCTNPVTDANIQTFNSTHYTTLSNPTDPPALSTDNFYLWWAYKVNEESSLPAFQVNGTSAKGLVQQLHDGMVPKSGTDTNGLLAYMEYVFNKSNCGTDVTACDLYAEVYGPFESYFQEVITSQTTLVEAIVESYSELASFYETASIHASNPHAHDSDVSVYMTGFQQMLSEEAESFLEVAEQIALYRAADGRFDWSSFSTSDAAQILARADFLAARLVGSASGTPWAWPPGVTGRIFYTQQPLDVPSSTTVHKACQGTNCATLTEAAPMPQDRACKTDSDYPGKCFLTGDWPYLQWTVPDSSNVVSGTPTSTWKLRRLTQQQMAEGTYQVASINTQYGNANLVVSQYGDDYSNPPAAGTTPVLFGSFNNVEGSLGIGALGPNRTYSGGSDDSVHDFTVSSLTNDTQMNVAYKWYSHTGPTMSADWYEKMKINLTAVSGSFARVRVFWPNTVAISLGSKYSGSCCDKYYQSMYQTLQLLNSSGSAVSGVNQTWHNCGSSSFTSCSYSITDRNGSTLLASSPVALSANQTYTLQARFHDTIEYYCGSPYCYCTQSPSSGSHVTWDLFNPTVVLVK